MLGLSHVPDQGARHHQPLSPDHPLGARGCAGAYAGSTGASPGGLEAPTINRGARVWHAHGMDGSDACLDEDVAARQHEIDWGLAHATMLAAENFCFHTASVARWSKNRFST